MPECKPSVWLNGRKPEFMESMERDFLTGEYIRKAVASMSYQGLQLCAAGYLLAMTKLHIPPAEICRLMEEA